MKLVPILILSILPCLALSLTCYSCQNGYENPTPCSNILPAGTWEECTQPKSQCVQSIEWFQNGALRLVMRKCWAPGNNTDYCKSYNNPMAQLKYCETCKNDLCNNKILYKPQTIVCGNKTIH